MVKIKYYIYVNQCRNKDVLCSRMIKIKYINPFFIPISFKTISLTAALTTFHVKVFTGDVWGAGTDANVYIILFGDKDTTGENRESDFVWFGLVSLRPRQLLGYIADWPQDRASDNFMCCHTRDRAGRP